ncbi:TPA: hypothetical protein KNO10_004033 [Clostridioides difficile]|uniref:hypothetical protein n=1 Tax=Clostridioides difficile TaxID=1496 RepID=UPI00098002F3|nr:hypothetical protein [Clostridioides difficile]SJW52107.1 Uncharacterised protein [Clostridioides difficile]SJW87227.1 Uncharacterised protein [Clostridioides difficile]HBF0730817.1 hypothetical protein [Clostridioides difficile]HBF0937511.1 hypothetical protein [Clostridioides difficile]HBF4679572.1 hypothetical protein [Clostridioides difficile]
MDIKDIKESLQEKPVRWILGVAIIAIIIIPLIVTFTISVRNPIFSFNESNGWLGFWGSYLGGILGGLATLMAVVITTNQTRIIQEENKLETREIQAESKKEKIYFQKKEFTDEICKCISEYITDACGYFYEQWYRKTEWEKRIDRKNALSIYFLLNIKLSEIDLSKDLLKQLDIIHKDLSFVDPNKDLALQRIDFEAAYKNLIKLTKKFTKEYMDL